MDTENVRKPGERGDARRPYQRPAVHWEEEFLPYVFSTCGKMGGQGGACVANKKS